MIANPKPGTRVRLAYALKRRKFFTLHDKLGTVVVVGRGRPKNHLVRLDGGGLVVVPCGHLIATKADA